MCEIKFLDNAGRRKRKIVCDAEIARAILKNHGDAARLVDQIPVKSTIKASALGAVRAADSKAS